jgi:hypothetical protein
MIPINVPPGGMKCAVFCWRLTSAWLQQVLADYLENAAAAAEALHKDPYSVPIYTERLEKHAAKAAREAVRDAARVASAASRAE